MKYTTLLVGAIATFWTTSVIAGPDLIPVVRNLFIENYQGTQHEIDDGCIPPGNHEVLRFDFLAENIGDADFVVGEPSQHPELFYYDVAHQHYHMRQFNKYDIYDLHGNLVVPSTKPGFCLRDSVKISPSAGPAKFTGCGATDVEGISVGWADLYSTQTLCQFMVIDHLHNGDYTLVGTTNAEQAVPEDNFANNVVCQGFHIQGRKLTLLANPTFCPS